MKNQQKVEVRIRVPKWVAEILEAEARASAAAQVLEEWAKQSHYNT